MIVPNPPSDDEKERGITIKSTAISMYFAMDKSDVADIKQKTDGKFYTPERCRLGRVWHRYVLLLYMVSSMPIEAV